MTELRRLLKNLTSLDAEELETRIRNVLAEELEDVALELEKAGGSLSIPTPSGIRVAATILRDRLGVLDHGVED